MRVKDAGEVKRLKTIWIFLFSVCFGIVELFSFYLKYECFRILQKGHFISNQFNTTANIKTCLNIQLIGRITVTYNVYSNIGTASLN